MGNTPVCGGGGTGTTRAATKCAQATLKLECVSGGGDDGSRE